MTENDCHPSSVTLSIGGESYALVSNGPDLLQELDSVYERFVTDVAPSVVLQITQSDLTRFPLGGAVYDSCGPWSLFKSSDAWAYMFRRPGADGSAFPYSILQLDFGLRQGTIHVPLTGEGSNPVFVFGYPISEVLAISLLAYARGVELHAVGLAWNGQGDVFCGISGAGKSTTARLWSDEPDVEILSDDRIIVRKQGGRFRLYGTPWHGDACFASPASAPLRRVFLLRHGVENSVRRLSAAEAVRRLSLCSFFPYWNREGVAFSLSFLEDMTITLPCYELTFVNDHSVVDFVRSL